MRIDRRETIKLASIMLAGLGAAGTPAQETGAPLASGTASKQDFDYFIGDWRVEHHRLRQRLAGSRDWEVFAGHTRCQQMFDGLVNLNESVAYRQGRKTYGLGLAGNEFLGACHTSRRAGSIGAHEISGELHEIDRCRTAPSDVGDVAGDSYGARLAPKIAGQQPGGVAHHAGSTVARNEREHIAAPMARKK